MASYFAANHAEDLRGSTAWIDIMLAFSANLRQIPALNALAGRIRLGLLAESVETIRALGKGLNHPVDLWLKIDSGAGRTGLPWDRPEWILEVARTALRFPRLRLRGLLTHAGHTYAAHDAKSAVGIAATAADRMNRVRAELQGYDIGPLLISTGDTPGCSSSGEFPGVDEIRPGNFVFYDVKQATGASCRWEDIAVALACPVVALHPERGEVVVYGGAIHLSTDAVEIDNRRTHGLVALPEQGPGGRWGNPLAGAFVARLSQEHGILQMGGEDLDRLKVGDLVCLLPAHSCLTAQCMGAYLTLTGRRISMMQS
jgi:D-serine deaminase-like pyridoxal phosphate-dependent protein